MTEFAMLQVRRHAELCFDGTFTLRKSDDPASRVIFTANVRNVSVQQDAADPLLLHLSPKTHLARALSSSPRYERKAKGEGSMSDAPDQLTFPGRTSSTDSSMSLVASAVSSSGIVPTMQTISSMNSAPEPDVPDINTPRIMEASTVEGGMTDEPRGTDALRRSSHGILMKLKNVHGRR